MNLAVVIISEQTIPNVVYLKNLQQIGRVFDHVLLITTKKMEDSGKSEAVLKGVSDEFLNPDRHTKIEVKEDMIFDVKSKIDDFLKDKRFDNIFVNITGGTKIMSLAVYDFFKDKKESTIFYLPIGSTISKQIKPLGKDGKAIDLPIEYKMSVEEYIKSLGLAIKKIDEPLDLSLSERLFNKFFDEYETFYNLTSLLMKYRKKKGYKELKKSREIKDVETYLKRLNLSVDAFDFTTTRDWIDYFSGGWFEEYIYLEMLRLKDRGCIDDAQINISLERASMDAKMPNEFDVIFIKNNSLNIIECKSGNLTNQQITSTFYKVAYLNSGFGLSATSYLALLGDGIFDKNGDIKADLKTKSQIFRIKIIDRNILIKRGLGEFFKCK